MENGFIREFEQTFFHKYKHYKKMKCSNTKKYTWYENPKYYLAAILLIWGFRLIIEALHRLLPRAIMFDGSIVDGLLYVVLFVSVVLFLKKGWRHGSGFSLLLTSGRPGSYLCSVQYCLNPGVCRILCL